MYQGTASGKALPYNDTCLVDTGGVYQITSVGANAAVNTYTNNNVGGDASATCVCSNSVDCTPEPFMTGVDRFGLFPVVASGMHSLMLNNSNCGYLMQRATQTIAVNLPNTVFTFQYAAVLQNGAHPKKDSPYFQVSVTDPLTCEVLGGCPQISVSASDITSGIIAGWSTSTIDPTVYYKPWTTFTIDLSQYLGRTVSIVFDVSDCNQGGHFGYAYIDANCNPLMITSCTTGFLSGPSGMATYTWTGPVTGNTQNLTTTTPGNYTLTATSVTSCTTTPTVLYYTLTSGSFSGVTVSATNDSICAGTTDILTAIGASTYTWSSNAGSVTTNTVSVSPTVNSTYTVIGTDSSGCVDTTSKIINVANCTTGINQVTSINNQIVVYPNPANSLLYIACKLKNSMLFITDILDNKIKQVNIDSELASVDISGLSEGVYFLNIKTANNTITKKVIVQR
jgi:hypothetical protein